MAQVINKSGGEASFSQNDELVFRYFKIKFHIRPEWSVSSSYIEINPELFFFFSKYLQFCGVGLRNAQLYERSQLEVRRNQVLLDLAGVIFQEQSTIDNMIDRILTHMLSLIR